MTPEDFEKYKFETDTTLELYSRRVEALVEAVKALDNIIVKLDDRVYALEHHTVMEK